MHRSNTLAFISDNKAPTLAAPTVPERRRTPRLRTVFRVARITARGDQGLARVQNISDDGLMITSSLALCLGDIVQVDLSDDCRLTGAVVWRHEKGCGLRLLREIDSAAMLRRLFDERQSGQARPLRLAHSKTVVVASQLGLSVAELRDVSQAGMKIAHDGRFDPGMPLKVLLKPGIERRGVVRWSKDGIAGIGLTEILGIEELGSLRSI
jgi:hypothetical protein